MRPVAPDLQESVLPSNEGARDEPGRWRPDAWFHQEVEALRCDNRGHRRGHRGGGTPTPRHHRAVRGVPLAEGQHPRGAQGRDIRLSGGGSPWGEGAHKKKGGAAVAARIPASGHGGGGGKGGERARALWLHHRCLRVPAAAPSSSSRPDYLLHP